MSYGAYELKKAWNEGQLNWNQAATGSLWATPSAKGTTDRGSQIASLTPTTIAPYTFTIPASVVQGWIDAPSSNNGILLANTIPRRNLPFTGGLPLIGLALIGLGALIAGIAVFRAVMRRTR